MSSAHVRETVTGAEYGKAEQAAVLHNIAVEGAVVSAACVVNVPVGDTPSLPAASLLLTR